jgi:hypothetical protein
VAKTTILTALGIEPQYINPDIGSGNAERGVTDKDAPRLKRLPIPIPPSGPYQFLGYLTTLFQLQSFYDVECHGEIMMK